MGRKCFTCIVAAILALVPAPAHSAGVPHQFIAKLYSEALGRAPDSTGYGLYVQMFRHYDCSIELLRTAARQSYDSPMYPALTEFAGDYPKGAGAGTADSIARILSLYRGILNRDPTTAEFSQQLNAYRAGPWSALLEGLLNGPEFATLAARICSQDFYGFGGPPYPAIDVPFVTPAFEVLGCAPTCVGYGQCRSDIPDPDALQSAMLCASLQAGPLGTVTVELAPQAVFHIHSPLVIPGNVLLRTRAPARGWGGFPSSRYALMARLVRASNFNGPLVALNRTTFGGAAVGRAQLHEVWVDGQRGPVEPNTADVNVMVAGGKGSEVFGCRVSDSAGWTNILVNGMSGGAECEQSLVRKNLVTAYTSCHYQSDRPNLWTDGISCSCENALIEDNQIVDATDVGIVLFRGTESTTQRSVARRNMVFSAGNAAWGALGADPLYGPYTREYDFTGARFEDNLIWSGNGHFDIGMMVGSAANDFGGATSIGRGATFVNNSLGWPALACSSRVDIGIAVSGMLDATVTGNRLGLQLLNLGNCPDLLTQCGSPSPPPLTAAVVASRCAGLASGIIQDALDFKIWHCLGHSPPHPSCSDGLNSTVGRGSTPLTLDAVYPNPTRGAIVVRCSSFRAGIIRLDILDIAGRRVAHGEATVYGPGQHDIPLDRSKRLSAGIYVVQIRQGASQSKRQVVVLN